MLTKIYVHCYCHWSNVKKSQHKHKFPVVWKAKSLKMKGGNLNQVIMHYFTLTEMAHFNVFR